MQRFRMLCALALLCSATAALAHPLSREARGIPSAGQDGGAVAKTVRANPFRAYPPSCVSYPLPTTPVGPVRTATLNLADIDGNNAGFNGQQGYFESVQVTVWREACSSGNSAVLIRFERAAGRAGLSPAPDVPAAAGTQTGRSNIPLRTAAEPNAYESDATIDGIFFSSTYVLDTYASANFGFDYDAAFTLGLDTIVSGQIQRTNIQVPVYNPADHPESGLALELNGYLSGSWYDTTRGGEGIQFEIGERPDGTRFLLYAWFSYGKSGEAFWLVGNVDIAIGARSVSVPSFFFRNGGFAGNFTPANLQQLPWGTVTFSFPNCNTMSLQFNGTSNDAEAPSGAGTRTWTRLTSTNGFVCQ